MGMFHGHNKNIGLGYGLLYNGFVVGNSKNIAPEGCHVPTQEDITILINYLGGASVAGGKLKEVGFIHWNSPNTGATNEVGFYGLGTGLRSRGIFSSIKNDGFFWTNTVAKLGIYNILWLNNNSTEVFFPAETSFLVGLPVRCICDISNSEIVDIDGNRYNTVTIGTQKWLVQNLKVTKYRDGTVIPEVTNNTTWEGLTTGALCAYNNDWDYV